uniref:AIG1-type G domain-containing protein n=1 Tax=Neolamprologus brichardi TaxID=32507 RepID=A0A3Q4G431_NEOBR
HCTCTGTGQRNALIVLLGDSEAGKRSLASTMFGEDTFMVDNTECQTKSKSLHGSRITLINTPDFSGPGRSEEELKPEILRCVTECTPGPHAFLIVLKVGKSTEQQQKVVIKKISQYFSEEVFKHAAVVFTQDGPDSDEMKIKAFIDQNKYLSDLMRKCTSRYHIINNYTRHGDNISNQSQVAKLLNTIDQIVAQNKGWCYTSKMLPQEDTHNKANNSVSKNKMIKLTGCAATSVAKAFSGPAVVVLTPGTTNRAEEPNAISEMKNNGTLTEMTSKVDGETTKKTGEEEEAVKTKEDLLLQGEREDGNAARKAEEAGGLECFVRFLFGVVVAVGAPLLKEGAVFIVSVIARAITLVTSALDSTPNAAGTTDVDAARAGGPAANVVETLRRALGDGNVPEWVEWVIEKIFNLLEWIRNDCDLWIIVFSSLLLTWYLLKVPFFGTLLVILLFAFFFKIHDMI